MDLESSILTYYDITSRSALERIAQSSVGCFAFGVGSTHYSSREIFAAVWIETTIGFVKVNIFGNCIQRFFDFLDGGRISNSDLILQLKYLRHMGRAQCTQSRHFIVQFHLFFDERIAGAQSLNFCVGQCDFFQILARTGGRLGCHNLTYEFLLLLNELPGVGIETPLCSIPIDLYRGVFVALAQNPPFALLNIRGTPGNIQVMQCNQFCLHIGSGTHFFGTAHQDAYFPSTHLCK